MSRNYLPRAHRQCARLTLEAPEPHYRAGVWDASNVVQPWSPIRSRSASGPRPARGHFGPSNADFALPDWSIELKRGRWRSLPSQLVRRTREAEGLGERGAIARLSQNLSNTEGFSHTCLAIQSGSLSLNKHVVALELLLWQL